MLGSVAKLRVLLLLADGECDFATLRPNWVRPSPTSAITSGCWRWEASSQRRGRAGHFAYYSLTARGEAMVALVRTLGFDADPVLT